MDIGAIKQHIKEQPRSSQRRHYCCWSQPRTFCSPWGRDWLSNNGDNKNHDNQQNN